MKKRKLFVFVLVFLLLFACVNTGFYAYWGRRHKVLYDVDRVYVSQSAENQNIYYLTYEVSVKNWWFDFREHTYRLESRLTGPYASWHFDGESYYFISENFRKNTFDITVKFDLETYCDDSPEPVKHAALAGRFAAYDKNGNYDENANLYMSDFADAEIIFQ